MRKKNIYFYANTAPFLQQIQSIKKVEGSWYDFPGILRVGYIFDTQHKLLMTLHFCLLYLCPYFPLETESHFKSLPALIDICIPRVEAWVNFLAVPDWE